MFKLKKDSTFKHNVEVSFPSENGTGFTKGSFIATFKALDEDKIAALDDASDGRLLTAVLMGVEGVADEDGNALPSNEDTVQAVINNPFASAALVREYVFVTKGKNLKRKNS